jgi:hypothetical protein
MCSHNCERDAVHCVQAAAAESIKKTSTVMQRYSVSLHAVVKNTKYYRVCVSVLYSLEIVDINFYYYGLL